MSRPTLELRQGQQLTMTPQLQQSLRLLQFSTLELEAEITLALSENPLLERNEDDEADQKPNDSEPLADSSAGGSGDDDAGVPEAARSTTLREHLLSQLGLAHVTERDAALVRLLIDELDDDGYLASPLDEVLS